MARPINPNSARQQRLAGKVVEKPKLATDQGRLVIPSGLVEALQRHGKGKRHIAGAPELNPFKVTNFHPPRSTPRKELRANDQMALDEAIQWAGNEWGSGGLLQNVFAQGLAFPGYPFLAELAQRPEYRTFSETIAREMTRKWIKFRGKAAKKGEPDEKADKIAELADFMDNLGVRDAYKTYAEHDGLYGRAHLFHEFGGNDGSTTKGVEELKSPIGLGNSDESKQKVKASGKLTALRPVEAYWAYPTTYNAINPLRNDWYNPQIWYSQGIEIHASRMPVLIGRPVPDLLKPAYSFGGISLSQLAMPYVDIWLETRESIGRLIHAFSVMVLSTDLQTIMQSGGALLMQRAELFNAIRDNNQLFLLNKGTEEFSNVNVPLSGLHELQAQAQEHLSSVSQIPTAIYTGISPTGLNASSEGEIRIFENTIHAYQESRFRKHLNVTVNFCMLSLWGSVDPDIVYDFVPLREMTEKETAEINKLKAETDDLLLNGCQAIDPGEIRTRVAGDADSGYDNIDPDDEPDIPEPEIPEEGGGKIDLKGNTSFGGGAKSKGGDTSRG